MELLDSDSLSETINAVGEAHLLGRKLPAGEKRAVAAWIASRQGLPGAYRGMFAPTQRDLAEGIRLFTGERLATQAGTAHVLSEEACRALLLMGVPGRAAREALGRASAAARAFLAGAEARERKAGRPFHGRFCCGKCSVSLWRHLAADGMDTALRRRWLAGAVKGLAAVRSDDGRWHGVPFYYTVSALCEVDGSAAACELRHAAPLLERVLKRPAGDDPFNVRRRAVAQRALERC